MLFTMFLFNNMPTTKIVLACQHVCGYEVSVITLSTSTRMTFLVVHCILATHIPLLHGIPFTPDQLPY